MSEETEKLPNLENWRKVAGELNTVGHSGFFDGEESETLWKAQQALDEAIEFVERFESIYNVKITL